MRQLALCLCALMTACAADSRGFSNDATARPDPAPDQGLEPDPPAPDNRPIPDFGPPPEPGPAPGVLFVGDVVELDGRPAVTAMGLDPAKVDTWVWSIARRPPESASPLVEHFDDDTQPAAGGMPDHPGTPVARFLIDREGDYLFDLNVYIDGELHPMPGHSLVVRAPQRLQVQLAWYTPGDPNPFDNDGADLDLHLRHPLGDTWSTPPLDCFYFNINPDWGDPGPAHNPLLDVDAIAGRTVESILFDSLEDSPAGQTYRVGVAYFNDMNLAQMPLGPSEAAVRIYVDGALAFETSRVLETSGIIWEAAEFRQVGERIDISPLDAIVEAPPIQRP